MPLRKKYSRHLHQQEERLANAEATSAWRASGVARDFFRGGGGAWWWKGGSEFSMGRREIVGASLYGGVSAARHTSDKKKHVFHLLSQLN